MADRKLFVGNLVRRITQEDLWVMYSTFGPLEECAKFHESFGFVRFLHPDDAKQALDGTHGIVLKGRRIKVEFAATTTSWRSANGSQCNDCRLTAHYNIPPIRAVDLASHRGHLQLTAGSSPALSSPFSIQPIGHRRASPSSSTTSSSELGHRNLIHSSPPSSYAASSGHVGDSDDYDCDIDSGFNDEPSSPLLRPSTFRLPLIPASPWCDTPIADEIFVWDFQLYADLARELPPPIKITHCNSESTDDDTLDNIDALAQFNLDEYL